jgi:hypothetical protein
MVPGGRWFAPREALPTSFKLRLESPCIDRAALIVVKA